MPRGGERPRPALGRGEGPHPRDRLPGSRAAAAESVRLIAEGLGRARRLFAPRSRAPWDGAFYQYANRLAFQFFLRELNGIDSRLVFLYFTNAGDMEGPTNEEEWRGAVRLIHAALGLPARLHEFGVYDAFIDARLLADVGPHAARIDT